MSILTLITGLAFLIAGAQILIRGGVSLASRLGISSLIIGLTIAAYGTSSPEMAVSAKAALGGQPDIALGDIIGSNIFNVLFIIGISSIITPLSISPQLAKRDVPIMILVSAIFYIMCMDHVLSQIDGIMLVAGIIAYTIFVIKHTPKNTNTTNRPNNSEKTNKKDRSTSIILNITLCLIGLAVLVLGSQLFVNGAVSIAQLLGVSETVIALTIIAAGTSMPEVATSIIATLRKEGDISVGNVIGSNIFNILGIAGIAAILSGPEGIKVSPGLL